MAVEDRSLSEFPRALQVAEQALVMISNPDGLGGYDTNGAVLTEVGKALLNVQYTQQLGNVSVFDAIKNCRVLSGTTTPTANEGANGQLYVKYETVSNVDTVIGMYFKKDGAWLEISLGGGGGASVTLGTTVPSDASGDNGDLYVQYDSSTFAVVEYFVKINGSWRIAPYSRVVSLTQAQYDLITPDPTTLYIITDAQSGYLLKSGGDITGTLTYKTNIDPSTAPSANKGFNIVALDDVNDNQLFRLETYQNSVNYIRGQMVVSRKVGNDTILNYFNIGIRPDGTKDVGISDPDKWRSALAVPQKLKIGTDVRNFSNGIVDVPLSAYGLSSKPDCVLMTPARGDVVMAYDWDQSSATNGLRITCRKTNDLTGITGNVRFSIAILA